MTTNLIYKPTFLQKLLGRNYKWWYVMKYFSKKITKYKLTIFGYISGEAIQALAVILLWQANFANQDFSQSQNIVTYFVVGYFILTFTKTYIDNSLPSMISNGKLVQYQMYPQNIFSILIARGTATVIVTNLLAILATPIFIVPFWRYLIGFQVDLFGVFIFILLLVIGIWFKFMWNIIVSSVAFWTPESAGIVTSASIIWQVLAGSLVPFYILGSNWKFLEFLAPAWTFYHPMQIYLGKYTTYEIIYVFLGGIAWCVVLYFLAKLVFKLGLKRNESVGL